MIAIDRVMLITDPTDQVMLISSDCYLIIESLNDFYRDYDNDY